MGECGWARPAHQGVCVSVGKARASRWAAVPAGEWGNTGEPEQLQLIPPKGLRQEIMRVCHAGMSGGHMGVRRTKAKVQRQAYWDGWGADVEAISAERVKSAPSITGGA